MNEMPQLQQRHPGEVQGTAGEGDRDALSPASLQGVSEGEHIGPDDALDGGIYGAGDGSSDPAFAFFRSDWLANWSEQPGYGGPAGFAKYLKSYGILSPKRERLAHDKEVTGTDLDRDRG